MSTIQRIEKILTEAEEGLASLAAEAAGERDYDTASGLIALAREIKELPKRFSHLLNRSDATLPAPAVNRAPAKPQPEPVRNAGVGKSKVGTYPKFVRESDNLVKIGWSKAERSEYEHKSPKRVLDLLLEALTKLGANGKRFAMESVIPLSDPTDGSEVPPYQLYLWLAWLRQEGLLIQHGRQGYSFKRDQNLAASVESRWQEIPTR